MKKAIKSILGTILIVVFSLPAKAGERPQLYLDVVKDDGSRSATYLDWSKCPYVTDGCAVPLIENRTSHKPMGA